MNINNEFFINLDTDKIINLIKSAKESVIYAAPGIRNQVADAVIQISEKINKEMVTLCLDVSEHAIRMGFGDFEAVSKLQKRFVINNIANLRLAFIIVDGNGYQFTPTALYLESEESTSLGINAVMLTPQQVEEAITRISPAAKAIAVAKCDNEAEKAKMLARLPEIPNTPLSINTINEIESSIKAKPLAAFDLTRHVRVFSSYVQYVEMSFTGAAIQRRKIQLPKSLDFIRSDNVELNARLSTSFDLIEKNINLSPNQIDKRLKDIRASYTTSLGKTKGRVILVRNRDKFKDEMANLANQVAEYSKNLSNSLQEELDKSKQAIVEMYFNQLGEKQPQQMEITLGEQATSENKKKWIENELSKVFPKVDDIIKKISLDYEFKELTIETLKDKNFTEHIKSLFPYEDWDKAYKEISTVASKE